METKQIGKQQSPDTPGLIIGAVKWSLPPSFPYSPSLLIHVWSRTTVNRIQFPVFGPFALSSHRRVALSFM